MENIRDFLTLLSDRDDLATIDAEVSSELEITEITERTIRTNGPALFFKNVSGSDIPVVINLFGSHQRMAWALGVDNVQEIADRVTKILKIPQNPPGGIMDKLNTLGDLAGIAKSQPKLVKSAPCQEIITVGEDVNLNELPILKCWPEDAGKFITLPLVISKDPQSGRRNVGTYRMQVYDERTVGMHWQTHKVGAKHFREGERRKDERLEVAVALGADPTTMWTGSMPLPPDMDEFAVSGVIRQKPVRLVKAKTVDLEVPAEAEIILEGFVVPGEYRTEGPFGDHTGFYSSADQYPVMHVTAITRRTDAIYPTTVVGRPPMEDFYMGKATERIMLPALKMVIPEIIDLNMPAEGIFHNLLIVSIRKEYPGHARKVMHALWGVGLLMLAKVIIVVDHDVDVHNSSEVAWRVAGNLNPEGDVVFTEGPLDDLDYSSPVIKYGSKMGIDATSKSQLDGFPRDWPEEIVMTKEIVDRVNERWQEFNL